MNFKTQRHKHRRPFKERMQNRIYVLPSLLTTGNLFFGFMSVVHSIRGNYMYAAYAIVAAAVFDLLDGRVARLTHSTSKFGAEYDSLCDLVSFGMAPGILVYLWALHPYGRFGWIAAFLFVACGALRLARFNVQSDVYGSNHFQGLPIPMAAGIISSAVLCYNKLGWEAEKSELLLGLTTLLALVMVSNFPYRSFKDIDFKRHGFNYLVIGTFVIAAIAYNPQVMLFVLFAGYAVLGAILGIFRIGKIRHMRTNHNTPNVNDREQDG